MDPSIRDLDARNLPDRDMASLAKFHDLTYLRFWGDADRERAGRYVGVTDEGLAHLARLELPRLNWLALFYCGEVTDAGLVHVATMKSIRRLALQGSPGITDAGLESISTMDLEYLDLRQCSGITDRSVPTLAKMRHLTRLSVGGCANLSPSARQAIRQALPQCNVDELLHDQAGN